MTEPYNLDEDESFQQFMDAPLPRTDTWIERVRSADADAENAFKEISYPENTVAADYAQLAAALIAIAAELRAARIARRPGAGQK